VDPQQRLQLMLDDMEQVDDLYRPTQFWGAALGDLTREIQQRGFADFRAHRSARKMYVPIYASGAYQKNRRTIERAAAAMRFVTRSDRLGDLFLNDHSGTRAAEREWAMFRAGDPTDRAPRSTSCRRAPSASRSSTSRSRGAATAARSSTI
jgi:hypothetical protein